MIRKPKRILLPEPDPEFNEAGLKSADKPESGDSPAGDAAEQIQPAAQEGSASAGTPKKKNPRSGRIKRAVVNNRMSLIMITVFFAFTLTLAVLLIVLPRPASSSIERRSLAVWPEFSVKNYFSGDYTDSITLFYDDTVPARDTLKNISSNIRSAFRISTPGTVEVIGSVSKVNSPSQEPETSDTAEPATVSPAAVEQETTSAVSEDHSKNYHAEDVDAVNLDGIIVAFQDGHWRAMSLLEYNYDSLYNDVVNYVRQVLDPDVNVYFMPIPPAIEFYCPPDYLDYTADLQEVFNTISSKMISGIKCINIIPALDAHNEENIYLRTDHHWAPLGAYYAARYFAENVNVPFADLSEYTEYVNEGYVGTMYAFTESANILNDPEDFVYYVPTNNYTADYYDSYFNYSWTAGIFADMDLENSYSTFLGGDNHIVKITTDTANGRRLAVIKDSYGNALIPFLTSSFEEIYVIDQRYFDVNLVNFIQYNNITDVVFANNYFGLAGPLAELLEYITYSNYDVQLSDDAPAAVLTD